MMHVIHSELLRLRRRNVLIGWFGLIITFAALINFVMFQVVEQSGPAAGDGPGVSFPSAATLLSADGIVAGLGAAASFFGVITLAFWALNTASDYSTGLVRIVVAAEPRRWRLLLGKWTALALVTALTCLVALVVNLVVAPIAAQAGGYSPDAWGTDVVSVVVSAVLHLYLSLLAWGSLGLALATVTRSAGVAIGVGVGYVLLLEAVIAAVATGISDWLPGSILTALAQGGNQSVSFTVACLLGAAYVVLALGGSLTLFGRRDITD
jgi:ABC-type transport system involved in multi-copper enzyme maturation permease subunit